MKPRPVKLTSTGFDRSERPPPGGWAETTTTFDDPEDKTPVAPAPTPEMLANAGAPWYSRNRFPLAVGAGMLLILVAFISGLRASSREAATAVIPPAAPPVPLVVTPAPAPPAVAETIVLSVTVAPANAQVLIDGQLMPSNPFLTRFPRSTATHRLRAVAPGYQPKERWVSFADNVMLDISLSPSDAPASRERSSSKRRDPTPARKPAPPAAAPPAHRATETMVRPDPEKPDKPRRRRIESSDPYAGDQ
jgi:hypothetical protein